MAPFILAPASPNQPDPSPSHLNALIQGFTALDAPRRLTGSLHARGKGGKGLGVLISTYCKGGWKTSPWGVRENTGEVRGIPRDMDEWERLNGVELDGELGSGLVRKVIVKGKKVERKERKSSGSGVSNVGAVKLVKASKEKAKSKEVNTMFKSSKASVSTSKKPRSSRPPPPPPQDPPRGSFQAGMLGGDFSSQPPLRIASNGKERAVEVEEETVEESFWSHDHTLGRGKDEEVLFSQGCTQMIMEPTTILPFSSPLPTHYLHIPLLPTFTPRLTATSTPLKDLARSRTEPDLESTSRSTDPKVRRTNTMSDLHSQPILRFPSAPASTEHRIDPLLDPFPRQPSAPVLPTSPTQEKPTSHTPEKTTSVLLTSILSSPGTQGKELEGQMESIGGFLADEMVE